MLSYLRDMFKKQSEVDKVAEKLIELCKEGLAADRRCFPEGFNPNPPTDQDWGTLGFITKQIQIQNEKLASAQLNAKNALIMKTKKVDT